MLETGDFIRIRLQDEARNKKPVGIYWLQAASVAALSDVEKREIWAWRAPSLLAAVIATLATFWGGMALVGRRAAFAGAALLACCVLLSTEGMIAKTDATLCAMTTLAMAALARIFMHAGGKRTAILFWAAVAMGVLVKGPITPMVVVLAIVTLSAWKRSIAWLAPLRSWIGVALAALIVTPWLVAIDMVTEGAFLVESLLGDIAPKISGGGEHASRPPGLHLALLPILIFPATIGLIPAAGVVWRAIRAPIGEISEDGVRFLIAWAAPGWLAFELATTKLAHYTLPLYPAIALLAGAGLLRFIDMGGVTRRAVLIAGFLFGGLCVVALCAYAATWRAPPDALPLDAIFIVLAVGGCVLIAAAACIATLRRPHIILGAAVGAAVLLLIMGREIIAPRADYVLVSRASVRALAAAKLDDATKPLLVIGYREPSLVFVEGTRTMLRRGDLAGPDAVADQPALVEARERDAFEASLHAHGLWFEPVGAAVTGQNYSNGDDVSLQPGRVRAVSDAQN